jgi:superfamily I DNA and RNA helicase
MKVINKDQSPQERELRNQRQRSFKELVTSLEKGEISTEDLPEEYLEKFKNYLPK